MAGPTAIPPSPDGPTLSAVPSEVPADIPSAVPSEGPSEVPANIPSEVPPEGPADIPAVLARGLSRSYGQVRAVRDVDLDVGRGEVLGLLGPDGAGKSTLLRLLATVLPPDAGDAAVLGRSVTREPDAVTPRIGYMSQRFSLYPDLSVAENLLFFARIRGVPRAARQARAQALLAGMGMAPFADRQAQHLSGGMKQKLMLAATLMHSPEVLLLDEPTTGVDPVSRREFWRILADLHTAGTTVLVATPYMDEAERCSHVVFLEAGRITHRGTPGEITARVPGTLLEVRSADPREALAVVAGLPGAVTSHLLGDEVRVLWDDAHHPEGVARVRTALAAAGIGMRDVRVVPVDLESAFALLMSGVAT